MDVGRRRMTMSFETLNLIAEFDSLGVGEYQYPKFNNFFSRYVLDSDPANMLQTVCPDVQLTRNDMSLEGKILQNISLENVMVRLGDRGKRRAWDCRVLHALLTGSPKLSFMHICMMNKWDSRETYG